MNPRQQERYQSQDRVRRLVRISLFIALIIIQVWVPFLGHIPLPIFNVTYVHVTVIVASLWLGWKAGSLVGLTWGINSLIYAYVSGHPVTFAVFSSPLISILPRVLMPVIIGNLERLLQARLSDRIRWSLLGGLGALLNTALVLGAMSLFRQSAFLTIYGGQDQQLWQILGLVILTNGIPEMILASIVTPLVMRALRRIG